MNPNPLSALNHFTVPCAMAGLLPEMSCPRTLRRRRGGQRPHTISGDCTCPQVHPRARPEPRTPKNYDVMRLTTPGVVRFHLRGEEPLPAVRPTRAPLMYQARSPVVR